MHASNSRETCVGQDTKWRVGRSMGATGGLEATGGHQTEVWGPSGVCAPGVTPSGSLGVEQLRAQRYVGEKIDLGCWEAAQMGDDGGLRCRDVKKESTQGDSKVFISSSGVLLGVEWEK